MWLEFDAAQTDFELIGLAKGFHAGAIKKLNCPHPGLPIDRPRMRSVTWQKDP